MSKRRTTKHLPTYTHERTTYAGIRERLALASLAYSKTWEATTGETSQMRFAGKYMHSVRFLSKKEGWEANFVWIDDINHVNLEEARGVKRAIAHSIESARARWFDNQHPSKELLAIVANVAARKAA